VGDRNVALSQGVARADLPWLRGAGARERSGGKTSAVPREGRTEIDLRKAEWTIPAERMKTKAPHHVPLSWQAVEAFRKLQEMNGKWPWIFPGRAPTMPMSKNTVLFALYRMGYHTRMTGHGFRALASTPLNEMGYRPDVIERQLAHSEKNAGSHV
jgi:integrase